MACPSSIELSTLTGVPHPSSKVPGCIALAAVVTMLCTEASAQVDPPSGGEGEPPSESSTPLADDATPDPPDDAHARAERLIARGVQARRQRREREALALFEQAHALAPSPRSLGQMALAEKSLRNFVPAEVHLLAALDAPDDPWVVRNREALQLALEIVNKHLAWLHVTTNVAGAALFVDGRRRATLPLETALRIEAGPVVVEVRAPGHRSARRQITVDASGRASLDVRLEPVATPPPRAEVTPPTTPRADPTPKSWLPGIVTAGAIGGAGLIVGTALGIRAVVVVDERNDRCPEAACADPRGVELDGQARSLATGSTASFVVGGLGVATAIVLWALEPTSPEPPVAVWLGPNQGGATVRIPF